MAKKQKGSKRSAKKNKRTAHPSEWESRKPVLKFAATFLVACIAFFLLTNMSWFGTFRRPILTMYSEISAVILNVLGYGVQANGEMLSSSNFTVSIEEGCDAIAPAILFAISVAIFPLPWMVRLRGLLLGLLAIIVLNLIRIISLYLTGIHLPSMFEFMHVDFWQALFIVFTVGIWIYWMKWGTAVSVKQQQLVS